MQLYYLKPINGEQDLPKEHDKTGYSVEVTALGKDGETYYGYFQLPVNKFFYRKTDTEEGCAVNYMVAYYAPFVPEGKISAEEVLRKALFENNNTGWGATIWERGITESKEYILGELVIEAMHEYAQQYASQPALTMQQAVGIWEASRIHEKEYRQWLYMDEPEGTSPDRDTYLKSLNLK